MFANKIKDYRESLEMTQKEFSKKIKSSRATVGHLESGLREPSTEVLSNLSIFSGKSINWWIDIDDKKVYAELNDLNLLLNYMIEAKRIKQNEPIDNEDMKYIQKMLYEEINKKFKRKETEK